MAPSFNATNLQFVKIAESVKYNKAKHNKMKYRSVVARCMGCRRAKWENGGKRCKCAVNYIVSHRDIMDSRVTT